MTLLRSTAALALDSRHSQRPHSHRRNMIPVRATRRSRSARPFLSVGRLPPTAHRQGAGRLYPHDQRAHRRGRNRSSLLPLHPVFFRGCVDPHQRRPAIKPDQAILVRRLLARRHVQYVGSVMGSKQRVARKTFPQRRRIQERINARGNDLHLVSPIVNWRAQFSGVTKACVLRHLTHS